MLNNVRTLATTFEANWAIATVQISLLLAVLLTLHSPDNGLCEATVSAGYATQHLNISFVSVDYHGLLHLRVCN